MQFELSGNLGNALSTLVGDNAVVSFFKKSVKKRRYLIDILFFIFISFLISIHILHHDNLETYLSQ